MATKTRPMLYAIRKDGKTAQMAPGEVRSDGVFVMLMGVKEVPVVLSAECKRLGVDPKSVTLGGPIECLGKLGLNPGGVEIMTLADSVDADRKAADAALEAKIPGVVEILKLAGSVADADREYDLAVTAQIERGTAMTAVKPFTADAERLASLLAANPRAAAYLAAKCQSESADWADNAGRGSAGKDAMACLMDGGSAEDAVEIMAGRREYDAD